MIPDWKLERFLTGDLPESEMREIRELEATDALLAQRIKLLREDNKAILNKLPFEAVADRIAKAKDIADAAEAKKVASSFRLLKFASAAVLVLAVALVALMTQRETVVAGGNVAGGDVAQARDAQIRRLHLPKRRWIRESRASMPAWKSGKRRRRESCSCRTWMKPAKAMKFNCAMPSRKNAMVSFLAWTAMAL